MSANDSLIPRPSLPPLQPTKTTFSTVLPPINQTPESLNKQPDPSSKSSVTDSVGISSPQSALALLASSASSSSSLPSLSLPIISNMSANHNVPENPQTQSFSPNSHSKTMRPSSTAPTTSSSSSNTNPPPTKRFRRKKVDHACVYCRRSHMTCDEKRPCTRCIRRNIGHLCHDEPKKRPGSVSLSPATSVTSPKSPSTQTGVPSSSPRSHVPELPPSASHQPSAMILTASHSPTSSLIFQKLEPRHQLPNNTNSNDRNSTSHNSDSPSYLTESHDPVLGASPYPLPSSNNLPTNDKSNSTTTTTTTNQSPPTSTFKQLPGSSTIISLDSMESEIKPGFDLNTRTSTSVIGQNSSTSENNNSNINNTHQNASTSIAPSSSSMNHSGSLNSKTSLGDWFGSQSILSQTSEFNQNLFFSEHANSEFASLGDFLTMIESPELLLGQTNADNTSSGALSNGNGSLNISPQLSRKTSVSDITKLSQALGFQLTNSSTHNTNNSGANNGEGNSTNVDFQNSIRPLSHFNSSTSLTSLNGNINNTNNTHHPVVSDSARDKFFLTAADPTVDVSPEERLKQVIRAKVDAGLLQPFNYARGYARLQQYMDNYMNQSSRKRILKPLSVFRPAFRAIAQSLLDVDLVLVEESFERMLLDYDRVFTSMAIPACLWRRTGEIYRGNKEFAGLVEASVDDLRDGKLAIYELMSEESAVNYWEKYGSIAFDPSQKAVLTSCNLRARDGRKKRACCFSFTIQRDRYNIPSCIVGNFIPIHP